MDLKMVDKLIRGKIFEIVVVVSLVLITIPIWQNFNKKMSSAEITTLKDYNLKFSVSNTDSNDIITISNDYYNNKSYKLLMKVNKDLDTDSSKLVINNVLYNLSDFTKYEEEDYNFYILASNYISGTSVSYEIEPRFMGKTIYYAYVFEESNNF
ncbi:MAG: hypothetical protein NC483_07205 [Ruminococcus sp.]|nr:hypothetical protein [Ruminococcus sp.]